jgi:NADPH:quinone reductase-like Zn-dependent oxidoreductase
MKRKGATNTCQINRCNQSFFFFSTFKGASGVGVAATQLLKSSLTKNERLFVTVSSEEKANFCRKIGADVAVIYKKEPEWEKPILEATNNKVCPAFCCFDCFFFLMIV